jgi:hypothetical protein
MFISTAYRDTLYISPISGAHLKNGNEIEDLMHQAVAVALKQLLRPSGTVHVHELIAALWRLKESAPDKIMRDSCERAIRLLAKKLN